MPRQAAARLAEIRGVTVRNTFLEVDDGDDLNHVGGLARQTSEPVKAWNRQLSDRTTAGSGGTIEEGTEADDSVFLNHTNGASHSRFLEAAPHHTFPSGGSAFHTAAYHHDQLPGASSVARSLFASAPQAAAKPLAATDLPVVRFCPSCGVEVVPNHRFCPYCCFQLHTFQRSRAGGAAQSPHAAARQPAPDHQNGAVPSVPGSAGSLHLVANLRRFRYLEAHPADVDCARAICVHLGVI